MLIKSNCLEDEHTVQLNPCTVAQQKWTVLLAFSLKHRCKDSLKPHQPLHTRCSLLLLRQAPINIPIHSYLPNCLQEGLGTYASLLTFEESCNFKKKTSSTVRSRWYSSGNPSWEYFASLARIRYRKHNTPYINRLFYNPQFVQIIGN